MKTVVIAVLGSLLLLVGVLMLVLPGPGYPVIAAGLSVLATRFAWARKPLAYAEGKADRGFDLIGGSTWRTVLAVVSGSLLICFGIAQIAGLIPPLLTVLAGVMMLTSGLTVLGTGLYARHRVHRKAGAAPVPTVTH